MNKMIRTKAVKEKGTGRTVTVAIWRLSDEYAVETWNVETDNLYIVSSDFLLI